MDYTVKQLGDLAGVSSRTLRYYDQLNLLKPKKINNSGYRIYGPDQVDRLQQILFFRELGFSLKEIQAFLAAPDFNLVTALTGQHHKLIEKRTRLNRLIATVEKTLAAKKGEMTMTDQEKFEGFKKEMIDRNEKNYGKEIREKYGEKSVAQSYKKFGSLSKEDYARAEAIQTDMFANLKHAMDNGADPGSKEAQKAADLHKQWLSFFWAAYSPEAHAGLAQMYVDDPRFTAYYDDRVGKSTAKLLRDAVLIYTKKKPS
jgi:Predicted transcriptional regulators